MRYLLDTHALIWLVGRGTTPSAATEDALRRGDTDLLVSSVSAFEIATKVRLGKLDSAAALLPAWDRVISTLGAVELPLTSGHARLAGSLTWDHRDPFDRLLVAQALSEDSVLISDDRAMQHAPGLRLMAW
jgi:PIN domain nuclease of toxin-antitoxin system